MQSFYEGKRRDARYNLSVPIHYQIRGSQEFGNTVTKNISSSGASFIINRFIKPQTHILFDVNILSRSVNIVGKVRWAGNLSHSDKYQLGLEFIDIAPQDKKYISDYINLYLA